MSKNIFKFIIKEFHESWQPSHILERELKVPLNTTKVIVVYGARRCGKTFYFYSLINSLTKSSVNKEKIIYINFEDDRLSSLKIEDLGDLLEAYYELYPSNLESTLYLFLDEIQNIEKWEQFARRINDTKKIKLFLTGSSAKLTSKEIATSLRGRCLSYALHPLNFREFLLFKNEDIKKDFEYSSQRYKVKKLLDDYIELGAFPEVVLCKDIEIKKKILREYHESLVYKDLLDRFKIKNSDLLKDLLKHLFTNFTSNFSTNSYYKTIKNTISVSRDTVSEYLNYVQETSYFYLLPHFSYSLKSQKVNPKKIIVLDNGLRNIGSFRLSTDTGKLAENLVGATLKNHHDEIFYFKDKSDIDFVVKKDNFLDVINVTYGEEIHEREIKSLLYFKKQFKNVKRLLLINKDHEATKNGINMVPLWKWLLGNPPILI